jgi:hypothetical protein
MSRGVQVLNESDVRAGDSGLGTGWVHAADPHRNPAQVSSLRSDVLQASGRTTQLLAAAR